MKIGIVGLGLIGGSWALTMKRFGHSCFGWDVNPAHRNIALELGLVEECFDIATLAQTCEMVFVAVPADVMPECCEAALLADSDVTVVEFGSVKQVLAKAFQHHPERQRLILAHPMAGTEYHGPQAAESHLFDHRMLLLCDASESEAERVAHLLALLGDIPMQVERLNSDEHDQRLACASHLSHAMSFGLALTVMEASTDEIPIVHLSGSGFASTVRLARSSPQMWVPIFTENSVALAGALDAYIEVMQRIKEAVLQRDKHELWALISRANGIAAWLPVANKP